MCWLQKVKKSAIYILGTLLLDRLILWGDLGCFLVKIAGPDLEVEHCILIPSVLEEAKSSILFFFHKISVYLFYASSVCILVVPH